MQQTLSTNNGLQKIQVTGQHPEDVAAAESPIPVVERPLSSEQITGASLVNHFPSSAPSLFSQEMVQDLSQVLIAQLQPQIEDSIRTQLITSLQEEMKNITLSAPQAVEIFDDNAVQTDAKTFSGLQHFFPQSPGFKSLEQAQAVQLSVLRERNILVILPTGGGKSLIWQIPALLESPRKMTTIVFAPLTTLLDDIKERCKTSRLSCAIWRSGVPMSQFDVVLASFESASQKGFQEWLTTRVTEKKDVGRIVVDECDYPLENMDFRPTMAALTSLVSHAVPLVLLTATLPPSCKPRLLHLYNLTNIQTIRARTYRPNISYQFRALSAKGTKDGQFNALLQGIKMAMGQPHETGLGMIFCRKKDDLERLHAALQSEHNVCKYYSGINDTLAKAEQDQRHIMDQWIAPETGVCWLLCTNIMSRGVDKPNVNATIHAGVPTSCSDFIQESGRAGRGGQTSKCFIIYTWKPEIPLDDQAGMHAILQALETNNCRRIPLYNFLEGQGFNCFMLGARTARCDNCVSAMKALTTGKQKRKADEQQVPDIGKSIRLNATEALQRNSIEALDRVLPQLLSQLHQKCLCCLVRGLVVEVRSHHIWSCPQLPSGTGRTYETVTGSINDLKSAIRSTLATRQIRNQCFRCLLPQTSIYHKAGKMKGNSGYTECMYGEDIMKDVLWSIWHDTKAGAWVRSLGGMKEDENDISIYVQWILGQSGREMRIHKLLPWLNQHHSKSGSAKTYIIVDEVVAVL